MPQERREIHACSSVQLEEALRVAEVDLTLVALGQTELLDRADALADEHRTTLRVERAVAREYDLIDAEKRDAACKGRRRAAEHRVAVEHLEVFHRRLGEPLEHFGLVAVGAARAELGPERFRPPGEVRNHAAAVVSDDAQLRQLL